jgi:hypothetical protein
MRHVRVQALSPSQRPKLSETSRLALRKSWQVTLSY